MKQQALIGCLAMAALSLPQLADAKNNHYGGISAKAGTLGFGVEYVQPINKYFGGRLGFNLLDWDYDLEKSDVSYNGDLELRTISLLADYHPWADSFRLSAGLFYNGNKIAITAEPNGNGTYEINDVDYPASAIDSINGEIEFSKLSPYFGIGWGAYPSSNHHWSFNIDLGVMYHGEPDPSLNVRCSPAMPAAACNQLRANVAAEERDLKNDIDDFRWYPVISVGASYSF